MACVRADGFTAAGSVPSTPVVQRPVIIGPKASLFKSLFDALPLDYLPRLRPRPKRRDTGLIAPPSPRPASSPLPSPGLMRVPSMTNLPPTGLAPPPHRPTTPSDGHDLLLPASPAPGSPSLFALGPPPRRGSTVSLTRRPGDEGGVAMRRVGSSSVAAGDRYR